MHTPFNLNMVCNSEKEIELLNKFRVAITTQMCYYFICLFCLKASFLGCYSCVL